MICGACGQHVKDGRAPADALASFAEVLARMEQLLASRIGAGARFDDAWDDARWRRELAVKLPEAEGVLDDVRSHLAGVRTVADVHAAFTAMRGRLALAAERLAGV